jgi:hypothetical protein
VVQRHPDGPIGPLERLLAYAGVDAVVTRRSVDSSSGPVLPMRFRKGETSLSLFATIATVGTGKDKG